MLLLCATLPAQAHDFYDRSCCADRDCHPTPCESIRAVPQGFDYTDPQDHAVYFFTRDKMHLSHDDQCHVCLHHVMIDGPGAALCLYLPIKAERTLSDASHYATHLIILHGPDGQIIAVNPLEVITVRTPRGEIQKHFHSSTKCLVFTADGKFVAVTEECQVVRERIEEDGGDE